MPLGVLLFLPYGVAVLAICGLVLPGIVELAVETPVTGPGVLLMLMLAYTIFTLTLVLQRKRAGRWFAVGLSTLSLPIAGGLALAGEPIAALLAAGLAAVLIGGLLTPSAGAWFDQP